MRRPTSTSWVALGLAAFAFGHPARGGESREPARERTAEEIQHCVRQNFPDVSMILSLRAVSLDRLGARQVLEAEMFWQKDPTTGFSNVLLLFDNPPELRGAKVLVREKQPQNDMFMYLPELLKKRRITTRMIQGHMMGTDYSYEDFERLRGLLIHLEGERKRDEQIDGRTTFVTESVPASDAGSEYTLIRSWVDQETCVPLKVGFYRSGIAEPAKLMSVSPKSIGKEKTGWMPREISMRDLRSGTETKIVVEKLAIDVPIHPRRFSEAALDQGN